MCDCVCGLLLLLAALPALAGPRVAPATAAAVGPSFDVHQQTALLARVGEAVALRCRVLHLADRAVSWVRSSDLQILTHAGAVFTADARVSCSEAPAGPAIGDTGSDELLGDILTSRDDTGRVTGAVHTLRIERLRMSDSGRYECQINTEPKLSLFFNLTVVESALPVVSVRAVGTNGGAVWGTRGGATRLTCEARYELAHSSAELSADVLAALPPLRMRWLHDGITLDPQGSRGGISLDTERWAGRVLSRLTLAQLSALDAGRYTCAAADRSATLLLRLRGMDDQDYEAIESEMETMQRDQAVARVSGTPRSQRAPISALLLLLLPLVLT
ncbi:uncharacterized protein LOC124534733 isoform X2 [Vanessa cardui]|uniref:uncharacterized protein LOC124534733 isoform X2 n=1 Tax=Vanessa cardui TaxID=171605 RepID=UPI001F145799|nr:uncharacterized protein LOC124534733 isoform X2 [Vanessa cardui]